MEFKLSDIDTLSSATKAFVSHDEKLRDLFEPQHPFYQIEQAIEGKKQFSQENRNILVTELKKQYNNILSSDSNNTVNQNIENLKNPNTYTITTGQQLHLFMGPAFVLHKIIATIKAAEYYKTLYPEYHFVPVYWLASEDHDFEEIKGTKVFQNQFDWQTEQAGATGRFHVEEVGKIIEDIKQNVSLSAENLSLLSDLENIYQQSKSLSEASIKITHYLFGSYGLICIDGDNKALKSLFIPQIKQEISTQITIEKFNAFSQILEKNGFSLQLKGRDINIFYLSHNKRSRIVLQDEKYHVMDTPIIFSKEELFNDIEKNPENYSPNAVLRPVYQETILPNICYIGGNAEVNYWLQLKDVFTANHISPPLLVLRPSVWIVPAKTLKWLEKQDINILSLLQAKNQKDLIQLLDKSDNNFLIKSNLFEVLKQDLQDLAVEGETKHLKELVEHGKLYEKLLKKIENELSEKRVQKIELDFKKLEHAKRSFFDLHNIQERQTSTLEMLIKYPSIAQLVYNSLEFKPSSGKIIFV